MLRLEKLEVLIQVLPLIPEVHHPIPVGLLLILEVHHLIQAQVQALIHPVLVPIRQVLVLVPAVQAGLLVPVPLEVAGVIVQAVVMDPVLIPNPNQHTVRLTVQPLATIP